MLPEVRSTCLLPEALAHDIIKCGKFLVARFHIDSVHRHAVHLCTYLARLTAWVATTTTWWLVRPGRPASERRSRQPTENKPNILVTTESLQLTANILGGHCIKRSLYWVVTFLLHVKVRKFGAMSYWGLCIHHTLRCPPAICGQKYLVHWMGVKQNFYCICLFVVCCCFFFGCVCFLRLKMRMLCLSLLNKNKL